MEVSPSTRRKLAHTAPWRLKKLSCQQFGIVSPELRGTLCCQKVRCAAHKGPRSGAVTVCETISALPQKRARVAVAHETPPPMTSTPAWSVHDFHELPAAGRNAVTLLQHHIFVTGLAVTAAVLVYEDLRIVGDALGLHSLNGKPSEGLLLRNILSHGHHLLIKSGTSDHSPEGLEFCRFLSAFSGVNSTRFLSMLICTSLSSFFSQLIDEISPIAKSLQCIPLSGRAFIANSYQCLRLQRGLKLDLSAPHTGHIQS